MSGSVRGLVEKSLRRVSIPASNPERARYLAGVSGISQKMLEPGTKQLIHCIRHKWIDLDIEMRRERLEKKLNELREVLWLCNKSRRKDAYAQFLGRVGFDIDAFLHSVELYAKGRQVNFRSLDSDKIATRKKLLQALKKKSFNHVISSLKIGLREADPVEIYEIAALLLNKIKQARSRLAHDDPAGYNRCLEEKDKGNLKDAGILFYDEIDIETKWNTLSALEHIGIYIDPDTIGLIPFDEFFQINGISGFISNTPISGIEGFSAESDLVLVSRMAVQHELQHIFDNFVLLQNEKGKKQEWEFRAYLAELAFCDDRVMLAASLMNGAETIYNERAHDIAWARLKKLIKTENPKTSKDIIEFAKKLLNQEYKKACKLTYDEIIEPVKKSICSS
jgi:hypothetical protein